MRTLPDFFGTVNDLPNNVLIENYEEILTLYYMVGRTYSGAVVCTSADPLQIKFQGSNDENATVCRSENELQTKCGKSIKTLSFNKLDDGSVVITFK